MVYVIHTGICDHECAQTMQDYGLGEIFGQVVSSKDVEHAKPAPVSRRCFAGESQHDLVSLKHQHHLASDHTFPTRQAPAQSLH